MNQKNKKHGPWIIKERNIKYKNKFGLKIYEDKVIQPDKKEGIFGFVEITEGVSILPIDAQLNVYLGKEFQYAIGEECLEPSSGGINIGETPKEAAKRELKEELGIIASKWINLGYTTPISGRINTKQHLFIAYDLKFTEQQLESTEIIHKVKISLEEAVKLVMNNKIRDTQSSLLILMANNYLNNSNYKK
jgi:ADP-ribose pyrophosphatase